MATQVVMPKLSPTMEEGQLSRWLKKEGDKVSMGEPLAEIDTDKATMEMQSLANGVLLKILVNEGESAPLGDPIAIVGAEGEDISNLIGAKKSAKGEAPTAKPEADETEEREQEPKKAAAAVAKPAPKEEAPRPVTPPSRDDGRQLISPIAARMAAEAGINLERSADLRRPINEIYPDAKISINDVILKVAAAALIQHPQVNASFQEKNIRYYEHADIGVAVATENGLITPVVRSADLKSLPEIGAEVRELAERARARKLKPEEYIGATFSISNLGMFGIDEFTAVINPPEGAILAIGAAAPKPVVHDGQIVIRQTMRVTMSCDHRVVDGAIGAKFLQTFKQIMENPLYLFLAQ